MANYISVIKRQSRPYIDSIKEDIKNRKNKEFFKPTGTQIYAGFQGSGKTISAVKHVVTILNAYPKAILVSNLHISKLKPIQPSEAIDQLKAGTFDPRRQYVIFSTVSELEKVLTGVNNSFYGVVYLIDEIHTYFNSRDSKEMPIWVFQQISQQRKQRKCIIGTSQLFTRVSKPFREQCDNIIFCRTIGGVLTLQTAVDAATFAIDYDGRMTGDIRKRGHFFHNEYIRNFYDTYQVINSGGQIDFENMVQPEKRSQFIGLKKIRTVK